MGWFEAGARAGRGRLAARWWTRAACSSRGPPQADHPDRSEGSQPESKCHRRDPSLRSGWHL